MLRYGDGPGWLAGQPAAIRRKVGRGSITYLGAWIDPALMRAFDARELKAAGVAPAFGPEPEGVEVMRRVGPGREVFILVNHGAASRMAEIPPGLFDVLAGRAAARQVVLPPQGVLVLERPHAL